MLELDDSLLLKEYVERGSEEAFAALVARHVNKVYSIALRHTRNAHQAEEITQAVFVTLARKSRQLGKRVILSGWLCRTARLSAMTFVRSETRRTRREQEAHLQNLLNESESEVWPQIAPLLDAALAGLSEADHDAVALRFLDGKSMKEVGVALGASEDAVKMRVNRAVEKLRIFFTRRGIVCSAAVLTAAISANAVQAAPIGLAVSVSAAAALSGTAIAATATTTAAKVTALITAQKTLIAGVAVVAVAAGVAIYWIQQLAAAPPVGVDGSLLPQSQPAVLAASPRETLPIALANDSFLGVLSDKKFLVEFDRNTRRTSNSAPAIHIKCLVAPTSNGSADFLKSLTSFVGRGLAASRVGVYAVTDGSPLSGQRIRVTGWMKTSAVGNWAGASLSVTRVNGDSGAWDLMHDRPLHGTKEWQQVEFIVDVPKEPCAITLMPTLYGTGEMWADGFQIDIAPPNTPATDVGRWTIWSQCPADFSIALDPAVTRNGHPALRIAYVSSEPPEKYSFVWWGKHEYDLDTFRKYLGHTVRMSVWAKSEDVMPRAGLDFQPKDLNGKRLKTLRSTDRILGATDWREYSIVCDIPEETKDFQTAVFMYGDGKLWVDTNSFKWEIVGTLPARKQLSPASRHITQPGDLIFASSGNSRASEGVANAIDNNKNTKYLNWDSGRDGNQIGAFSPSGFAVQPAVGPTVVTGMGIQSANDADDRDPDVVILEGSNDRNLTSYESGIWTPITTISNIAAGFTDRFQSQEFLFSNAIPYRNYRWRVEATRIMANRCCMQVAEVWLIASARTNQAGSPAAAELRR
ncbi:MAG: sigma-70 family RNA polymerase sigma factor [Verrucomicrobia bacterium]|nr:sigma-70 family RNA polymerase sigma factor [Verrucomicrobiota bacterium]